MDLKNYTARWTDEKFSEIQAKRGRLGGLKNGVANWDKREQAKEFRATGMTLQAIADRLEVAKGTISKWLKKWQILGDVSKAISDNSPKGGEGLPAQAQPRGLENS